MKKKNKTRFEEIIQDYGSLEAYNEEQRRCSMATIETALGINPFTKQFTIENAMPIEVAEEKPARQIFWFKLFT